MPDTNQNTARIRELNDLFRTSFIGGKVMLTHGIQTLPEQDQSCIIEKAQRFKNFNEDNDPHQEHDFGSFDHAAHKIFWKIDYYDANLKYGSENPANPKQTTRVLTIMLAAEY